MKRSIDRFSFDNTPCGALHNFAVLYTISVHLKKHVLSASMRYNIANVVSTYVDTSFKFTSAQGTTTRNGALTEIHYVRFLNGFLHRHSGAVYSRIVLFLDSQSLLTMGVYSTVNKPRSACPRLCTSSFIIRIPFLSRFVHHWVKWLPPYSTCKW